jgi:hypothetical protein
VIPFENCWPYEIYGEDVYFHQCPSCGADEVRLPLKRRDLDEIRGGKRRLLVMPCCHAEYKLADADADYVLADRPMRSRE